MKSIAQTGSLCSGRRRTIPFSEPGAPVDIDGGFPGTAYTFGFVFAADPTAAIE
jgi:hypothetical protein